MALAGRRRLRITLAPKSGENAPEPARAPAAKLSPFGGSRKLRTTVKKPVFVIDLAKGTAAPAGAAAPAGTAAPGDQVSAGYSSERPAKANAELFVQPVSRLETRKAMAKAGLLTTSDVVDMSALASKLEKRAAAMTTDPTLKFGK